MQRWFLWLNQLREAGSKGIYSRDAVVRDPDKCSRVLRDKGYDISYRFERGEIRYTLVAEPPPISSVSTFPGEVPEVTDGQETLF